MGIYAPDGSGTYRSIEFVFCRCDRRFTNPSKAFSGPIRYIRLGRGWYRELYPRLESPYCVIPDYRLGSTMLCGRDPLWIAVRVSWGVALLLWHH